MAFLIHADWVNGTFGLNTSDSCSSLTEGSLSIWLLAYNAAGNPYDIYLTGYLPQLALRVTGASTFPTSSGAEAKLFAGNYAWEVGKGGSGTVNFSDHVPTERQFGAGGQARRW